MIILLVIAGATFTEGPIRGACLLGLIVIAALLLLDVIAGLSDPTFELKASERMYEREEASRQERLSSLYR